MPVNAVEPTVVWLVAATFEPRGSTHYTLRLARHLADFGFEPVIICESDDAIPARTRAKLDVRVVPRMQSTFFGNAALRALARTSDDRPALIHSQRRGLEAVGNLLADAFDVPHLLTIHNLIGTTQPLAVPVQDLSAIIAVSPSVRRALILQGEAPEDRVHVIASGVDVPEMPRVPPARDPDSIPIVGTASALEPGKGVLYFLMAAELILSAGHDVEFVIAGAGADEDVLRRAAQNLDIANRVTFATHVFNYTQIIETFDVFVLPSLEQGLGTIMLEAMAQAKPVVATRVGGVADFVVDGEHAMLVDKENHMVLADKIESLLDFPDKARRLALNGQELVRRQFTTERMTADTAALYRQMLK
jgi:glycosyltransferase involved in cell wall biosynthesis